MKKIAPHPNPGRQIEIKAYERLLNRLANIPVAWDHTFRPSLPILSSHGPDRMKVGRLIQQARMLLARTGVRKLVS